MDIIISIISASFGGSSSSPLLIVGMVLLPFVVGIIFALICSMILKQLKDNRHKLIYFVIFLMLSTIGGLLLDKFLFKSFSLNYLLIGMAFSATIVNIIPSKELEKMFKFYDPFLNISLIIVIINLGMPLDYHLIAGAGLFTFLYIISRALGKISGAFIGGKLTKAKPSVTKYLGLTLLPHSGVSLVFTGIAVTTLSSIDPSLASIVSGTIVASAIINEVIAVILSKIAFKASGEINSN